jgi:hypothetical protein
MVQSFFQLTILPEECPPEILFFESTTYIMGSKKKKREDL